MSSWNDRRPRKVSLKIGETAHGHGAGRDRHAPEIAVARCFSHRRQFQCHLPLCLLTR
ncbi:hypothetical protein GDI0240 [Gluconacetobacter diazotrophicus PA1 5]|uniref:Uncharacterized protein n=1 Tax=Gluconacetobacter diazotrophicus (strain ATCC 49037 / DSM 5601 / CCUG 37298 / CIP 103539 / LMG 7603 / PAl5) TaxID=272568 RepID=A9H2Q0_GLUDA|nr:hypothetical protein GDI0240 [Gluconacetobacter diazotrophicus PA1 5]